MQILSNEKVKEKGVVLVVGILKEPQAQQATVELLNNVLWDQKFIYHGELYIADLLYKIINTGEMMHITKILFEKMLRRQDMILGKDYRD